MRVIFFNLILLFYLHGSYCFDTRVEGKLLSCEKETNFLSGPPYHTIDECHRKIRLIINMTNENKSPEGFLYVYVKEIKDPSTGVKMQLLNPIVLQFRQSQVVLAYPFQYISAVNGRVSEVIVNHENRVNYTGCDDSSFLNPTCGIKYDKGIPLAYSEGFCCFCPENAVKEKQTRGGQDCSKEVDPNNFELQKKKASAHCLHFSDIWYSVHALSDPLIFHEVSVQVFNELYFSNGTAEWVSLTNFEEFNLGTKNPSQFDKNKTIVMTFVTENPSNESVTISVEEIRLLIPQPMPRFETEKLPPPVKNGAKDYLLISKEVVEPTGKKCNTAGVSYEGFAKQENRCNVPKNSCLENQPLDLWEKDDESRKAKTKGKYILENYGTPNKEPIIIDKETKEHWLALDHYQKLKSILTVEINADRIVALTPGKHAQITSVVSASIEKKITFFVIISNKDLSPATLTVKVHECGFEVPDSDNSSKVIPPQRRETFEVHTAPGKLALNEKFTCVVLVSDLNYGIVAKRKALIKPKERCLCNMHCQCQCLGESLVCQPLSQEDYQAAGFRGSLPVLIAKPNHRNWIVHHPFLAMLAFLLLLLLLGLVKGVLGLMGLFRIRDIGLDSRIFSKRRLKTYIEDELQGFEVIYDLKGYPVHPITKTPVRVLGEKEIFGLNVIFFCIFPFIRLFDQMYYRKEEMPLPPIDYLADDDEYFDNSTFDESSEERIYKPVRDSGSAEQFKQRSSQRASRADGGSVYSNVGRHRAQSDDINKRRGRSSVPNADHDPESSNIISARASRSFSSVPRERDKNPDPVNQELVRWKKGTDLIQAIMPN